MKAWPILVLLAICGCGGTPEQAPATTPAPSEKTSSTEKVSAKTPAVETLSAEELAQRDFDAEVSVFKKWVESNYGKGLGALNQPRQPGEPVSLTGEGHWPKEKHIPFIQVLKRQAGPPPPEGVERLRVMCAEGVARFKKLGEHPYAQKHPWEMPRHPEFDADYLIKEHREQANKYYQHHLEILRKTDSEAAQEIEAGIIVTPEQLAARDKERADRAAHEAEKKHLKKLSDFIEGRAATLVSQYQNTSIGNADLKFWIDYGTVLRERDATQLFNDEQLKSLREACREIKEVIEGLKISSARFQDPVTLPEPASYDADSLIAKQAKKENDKILAEHEKTMLPYSPVAVQLLKEGKATFGEILAAAREERKAKLDSILENRQKILATRDEARKKFEEAMTLEEMKSALAETDRIYKVSLPANDQEITRWRGDCHRIGLVEMEKLAEVPPIPNPYSKMNAVVKWVEHEKLDLSDPAERAKVLKQLSK